MTPRHRTSGIVLLSLSVLGSVLIWRASRTIIQDQPTPDTVLRRVASLAIYRWVYRWQPRVRHLGPMAQDFHRLFHLGDSPKRIYTSDMLGILLACVKALDAQIREIQERMGISEDAGELL